jgi:hypothetical protein
LSGGTTDTVIASGSFTGSLIGNLTGTASFATTASFALNASSTAAFPFSGSARITGSLGVTGSSTLTGSLTIVGATTITGSLNLTGSITFQTASITANSGVSIDLSNIGQTQGNRGLQLPTSAPHTPAIGSFYFDGARLQVYDGAGWKTFEPLV